MNIVIKTYNGYTVVRPDTTWERYNRDCYVPDGVKILGWVPVVYSKVFHPGKYIQDKFSARYIEPLYKYGILFFPDESGLLGSDNFTPECYTQACCYDHSSFLPDPIPEELKDSYIDPFYLEIDGKEIFRTGLEAEAFIRAAAVSVSKRTLLRNGDIVAMELSPMQFLKAGGTVTFCGRYVSAKETPLLDFKVIMQ